MRNTGSSRETTEDEEERGSRHSGFAVGAVFIALAIALNFILDGMSSDDVAALPWFIAVAFDSGGKLGVTIVLCAIGVGFVAWDVLTHKEVAAPRTVGRRGAGGERGTGGGGVELSSAKYLNTRAASDDEEGGGGGRMPEFRKGRTRDTRSDD